MRPSLFLLSFFSIFFLDKLNFPKTDIRYIFPDPPPRSEFFSTLSKFVAEFVACRDVLERQRKAELRRAKDSTLKQALGKNDVIGQRRASVQAGSTSLKMAQAILGVTSGTIDESKDPSPAAATESAGELSQDKAPGPGRRSSMF